MATSLEPETSQRYVEFHEYVDYQLAKTRTSIKTTDLLTALTGSATLLLAYVLLFVVLDHWAIPGGFSYLPRLLLLGAVVLAVAIWIVWKVVLPARRRITPLFAAHSIEQAEPELRSNLLNLVDLRRSARAIPVDVKLAMERRAALSLSEMDIDEAVDRRGLLHLSYALLAVVLLFCVYTLLSPKSVSASVWRALFPAAKVAVATRTEILNVIPGDVEVVARAELVVKVDLRGERPEQVILHYTTADRRYVDEPVLLRPVDEGLLQYTGTVTGDNGRGILQDLTYSIQAGDARSEVYHVTVLQPPSARVDQVTYEYPPYMELVPRTQPGGQIDTWEGATVSIQAQANMPVRTAVIKFSDTEDTSQKAEELRMTVINKTTLEATWKAEFRSDGTFPRFYRIVCTNERGDSDPEPALYSIAIHPDKPPEINLLSPEGDLQIPANGIVPLVVEARDPDFQLREVVLRTEKDGQLLDAHSPVVFEGRQTSFRGNYDFALAPLELQPGDELTYWLEARDNKQPLFNRRNTSRLKIQIVEPVSEEQAQKQLAEDKQKQQEQLRRQEEAAEQAGDEPQADQQQADRSQADQPQEDGTEGDRQQPDRQQADNQQQAADEGPGQQEEGGEQQENGAQQEGGQQKADGRQQEPGQQTQPGERSEAGQQNGEGQRGEGQSQKAGADGQKQTSQASQASDQSGDGSSEGLRNDGEDDDEAIRKLYEKLKEQQQKQDQAGDDPGSANQPPDQQQPSDAANGDPQPGEKETSSQSPQPGAADEKPTGTDSQTQPSAADPNATPSPDPSAPPKAGDAPNAPSKQDGAPKTDQAAKPDGTAGEKPRPGEQQEVGSDNTAADKPGDQQNDGGDPNKSGQPPANESPTEQAQQNPERAGQDSGAARSSKTGDPAAQTREGQEQKNPDPDAVDPDRERQPSEAGSAKRQDQPNAGDEPLDPESPPADGKSDEASGGQPGSSKMASDGKSGSNQQGAGEKGSQSGDSQSGSPKPDSPPGDPKQGDPKQQGSGGDSKADPSQSGAGKSGDPKSTDPKASDPQSKEGKPDDANSGEGKSGDKGQPGAKPEGSKPGDAKGGESGKSGQDAAGPSGEGSSKSSSEGSAGSGQKPSTGEGAGPPPEGGTSGAGTGADGPASGIPGPEEANLEFSRKAANLVLKDLEEGLQRGDVDQKLLDELGWNKADMQKFAERLKKQLEMPTQGSTPAEEARRRQFEEMLKNLDLKSSAKMRTGDVERKEAFEAIDARRVPIPSEFREAFDDYTKSLSKQKN